jgi:hypothetical protein
MEVFGVGRDLFILAIIGCRRFSIVRVSAAIVARTDIAQPSTYTAPRPFLGSRQHGTTTRSKQPIAALPFLTFDAEQQKTSLTNERDTIL